MSISFPGADGLLRQDLAALLEEAGRDGLDQGQLQREVDAGPGELERALHTLQAEGRAVETDGRWYAPRYSGGTAGIVELLEEGDALIRPGFREEPAFFVRRRNLKQAQDGDTVLVRRLARKAQPWTGRLPEAIAEMERTLEVKPESPEVMGYLASLYREQKDLKRAVALLDKTDAGTRPVRLLGVSVHNLVDPEEPGGEPGLPFAGCG